MYITMIAPECAPVAKVGGLADVVFGLSRELEIRGNAVEIILPKYDCLRADHVWGLQIAFRDLWVPWYDGAVHCSVWFGFVYGRKCFFIEPHSSDRFFERGLFYGCADDVMRFAFFSKAAMEFLLQSDKHPDILHCHDWQTALAPVLLYEIYQAQGMTHSRVCITIHNFRHQGVTGGEILRATKLDRPEYYFSPDRLRDDHNPAALNLMKAGIVYSNFVTTVSPRHAWEAQTTEQGHGLGHTLYAHRAKFGGVLNGIDYDVWNPEIDPLIARPYGADTVEDKYANKAALRGRLLLEEAFRPIVAFIGRLDPQKGLDLIRHALFYTLNRGGQFALLGSSPEPGIHHEFLALKQRLNDDPNVHLELGFDEELAHRMYAGADLILVPSLFEPCGLTQMIAMRYGTIPVVRAVGGLADTVFDKDASDRPLRERNGFVFHDPSPAALEGALGRALSLWFDYPADFRELVQQAMQCDYSWNHPGGHYLNIYELIRNK
jgi:starch synthase